MVEKTLQGGEAAGAAGDPAVQTDRYHLRRSRALGVEHVDAVAQIVEELLVGIESMHGCKNVCRWLPAYTARPDAVRRRRSPNTADRRRMEVAATLGSLYHKYLN